MEIPDTSPPQAKGPAVAKTKAAKTAKAQEMPAPEPARQALGIEFHVSAEKGKVIAMFTESASPDIVWPDESGMFAGYISCCADALAGLTASAPFQKNDDADMALAKDIAAGKLMAKYHKKMRKIYRMAGREGRRWRLLRRWLK